MAEPYRRELTEILTAAGYPPDAAGITCEHFFAGAAAYADRAIFMTWTPAGLALKLGPADRARVLARGGRALRYFPEAPVKQAYVVLPDDSRAAPAALAPLIAASLDFVRMRPGRRS